MSKIVFLIKNTSWFFGANIVGGVLSIALLPLYTSYLSPADYGIIAICLMTANIISCFSTAGLEYFCNRVSYRFRDKKAHLSILLGNIYGFTFILILFTSLVISFFPNFIHHYFFNDSEIPSIIVIFVPIWLAFFQRIIRITTRYLTVTQKGQEYFVLNSSQAFAAHILKVIALVLLQAGVIGFLIAELVTQFMLAAVSVWLLTRYVKPKVNFKIKRIVKIGFSYGIPFIPQTLGTWMMQYVDRIILLRLVDMSSVGLYSFALGVSSRIYEMFWSAIERGVFPEVMVRMDNKKEYPESEKYAIEYLYTYFTFASLMGLAFSLFAKEILYILANERFRQAYVIIPFFILMLMFQNGRSIFSLPVELKFKTWFYPFNTFFGAILNVILNLFLIPLFGIIGAALASAITSFIIMLTTLFFSQRQIYIRYNYIIASLPIMGSTIMFLPKLFFEYSLLWSICVSLFLMMIALFLSTIYLMNYCPTVWKVICTAYHRLLMSIVAFYERKRTIIKVDE